VHWSTDLELKRGKPNVVKIIFMDIVALLAAQYAGLVVYLLLSYALGYGPPGVGLLRHAIMAALVSFIFGPLFLLVTWKAALVAILIGEIMRRPYYYYPVAGLIAGYWVSCTSPHATGRFDPFMITVSGGVAGYIFWYIAVKCFDFDMVGDPSLGANVDDLDSNAKARHQPDTPADGEPKSNGNVLH
jgi:hypothetical protein